MAGNILGHLKGTFPSHPSDVSTGRVVRIVRTLQGHGKQIRKAAGWTFRAQCCVVGTSGCSKS